MSSSSRSCVSAALLLGLVGCASPPPLPEVDLKKLPATMRAGVEEAWSVALGKPGDDKAVAAFGRQLHAAMDYANAATVYRRARALKKDSYEYAYLDGRASLSAGDFANGAKAFSAALALRPASIPARLGLAEAYGAQGDANAAAEQYRQLGKHPMAHFGVARSLQGRAALEEYEKALALDPTFGAAHEAIALVAGQLGDQARAAQAREAAEKFRKSGPIIEDPEMAAILQIARGSNDRMRQGLLAEKEGRLGDAARILEQAVAEDPSRSQAWLTLIGVYTRLKNYAAAEKSYQQLLTLGPAPADAHYNYAVGLLESNRRADAQTVLEKAIQADPKHVLAHYNLGVLAADARQVPRAAAMFEKTLALDPGYRSAKFHLGRVRTAQKRFDEAIQLLMGAAEPLDNLTPYVLYALGGALNGKGESANALKVLERARGIAQERGMKQVVAEIEKDIAGLKQVR